MKTYRVAYVAFKGTWLIVNLHVFVSVVFKVEVLSTNTADPGPRPCVDHHVLLQVSQPRKVLFTD